MRILGLNAYHGDSSACLVVDGKVINALEEERIRRVKHWAGFPSEAIKWCLKDANLAISDIDYIAISRNPSAHLSEKILRALVKTPSFDFLKSRVTNAIKIKDVKVELANAFKVDISDIKAKIENVEHHKAHIGSSFLVSGFNNAACVTVDGFGDFVSTMQAIGKGNKIEILNFVGFPHSLGIYYTAITQFLGFWNYGDEYKVMGLSSYGDLTYVNEIKEIIKLKDNGLFELNTLFFLHDKEGVEMVWDDGLPQIGKIFSDKLIQLLGEPRKNNSEITQREKDIAASMQAVYEDAFFHILNNMYEKTKLESLTLAGGCIQNSLANGKIKDKTKFKNVYIPPAAHDSGTAIGAAMVTWYEKSNSKREFIMESAYLGASFSNTEIRLAINKYQLELDRLDATVVLLEGEDALYKKVAEAISNGNIVGWFQGRSELGPRALGNRSIVCDPRKKEMQDILNQRIKRREWFRPFAPSILEEKTTEWFECSDSVLFMEKVYKIKESKRSLIPAVCHVDGTGRLQTVSYKTNPRYYNLIKEYEKITGIPVVLNTSFNENEPIVNTPDEALECFIRTKMDNLILGDFFIARNSNLTN